MPKKTDPSNEALYTVAEVARLLRVTDRAVQKWCDKGRFAGAYKLGEGRSNWRIPVSSYEAFVNSRKESAQAEVA